MQNVLKLHDKLTNLAKVSSDYVVNTSGLLVKDQKIHMQTDNGTAILNVNDVAFEQISKTCKVPRDYMRRMIEHIPSLYDTTVQGWLKHRNKNVMTRCYLGTDENEHQHSTLRALLSDTYGVLDNHDILMAVIEQLNVIRKQGLTLEIVQADVTDTKMYIKIIAPEIQAQSKELLSRYRRPDGKHVHGNDNYGVGIGMEITNSEVGRGAFATRPLAIISKCANKMIFREDQVRKIHVGQRLDTGSVRWSKQTKNSSFNLAISQLRDCMSSWMTSEYLGAKVSHLERIGNEQLHKSSDSIAAVLKEEGFFSKSDSENILNAFIQGGDTRAFGVAQAITWESQKLSDVDKQWEWEARALSIVPKVFKVDQKLSLN